MTKTKPHKGDATPDDRWTHRVCIKDEDAQRPTLPKMIGLYQHNHKPIDDATLKNGEIYGDANVDTPDGDFRGVPVEIEGEFTEVEFSFSETIHILGQEIVTTYEGRHIGNCGYGWKWEQGL